MVNSTHTHKKDIEAVYPLSPMQQGILFHALHFPESHAFFTQLMLTIEGELDIDAFRQAWQQIIERHPILRTIFVWENVKKPLQIVRKQVNLPWTYFDWRSMSFTQQKEQWDIFLQGERDQGFELNKAPLMRCTLIRIEDKKYQFAWSHHHLLLDGWSLPLVLKEVLTFYQSSIHQETAQLPVPRPYRDYIVWLQQQDSLKGQGFWREYLKDFTPPNPLEINRTEKNYFVKKKAYKNYSIHLPATLTEALQRLAKKHHLSLSILIYSAWAILLSRYSGEPEVVFGSLVSGRPPSITGVESMVGMFFNTLPVRFTVPEETSLLSWLEKFQQKHAELQQYAYTPLAEIQKWGELDQGRALFDSVVAFQNYPH